MRRPSGPTRAWSTGRWVALPLIILLTIATLASVSDSSPDTPPHAARDAAPPAPAAGAAGAPQGQGVQGHAPADEVTNDDSSGDEEGVDNMLTEGARAAKLLAYPQQRPSRKHPALHPKLRGGSRNRRLMVHVWKTGMSR